MNEVNYTRFSIKNPFQPVLTIQNTLGKRGWHSFIIPAIAIIETTRGSWLTILLYQAEWFVTIYNAWTIAVAVEQSSSRWIDWEVNFFILAIDMVIHLTD